MNLRNIDLNLLVVLDVLIQEKNVTRAAEKIGLSQSAMSSALNRLRDILEDRLLIRQGDRMVPTARAQNLAGPIRRILKDIEDTLYSCPTFDAKKSNRKFSIATTDYGEFVILPKLASQLEKVAPAIELELIRIEIKDIFSFLEKRRVDMVISPKFELPAGFVFESLFDEDFVCLVRSHHPKIKDKLTLDDYLQAKHLLISQSGSRIGIVDKALKKIGLTRQVTITLPHFMIAPWVISETDAVIAIARRISERFINFMPLKSFPCPIEIEGFTMGMTWHRRFENDPSHKWFRNQLYQLKELLEPER